MIHIITFNLEIEIYQLCYFYLAGKETGVQKQ